MRRIKNYWGMIVLTIIMLIFVVGGFFTMRYFTHYRKNKSTTSSETKKEIDIRIDKSKDYFYYNNEEELIASMEIEYVEPYFNIEGAEELNNTLKQEVTALKATIKKYNEDDELPESAETNEEMIYSLTYRDYKDYSYDKYLSLVVLDYNYDIVNGSVPSKLGAYVLNKETGKIITNEELLSMFNVTFDDVKAKVKERLNEDVLLHEKAGVTVDVTGSMNALDNYALYLNKFGELEITFVVKTSENNYNDNVVVSS